MSEGLAWPDSLAIALYFILVIGVGLCATWRAKTDSTQGYFLAGKSMTWIPIGASTWATNIGAPMFVGLAGSAAASGISVVMFEWHAMLMLILLGWLFLPVYMACGCSTMPQYLKMRFGGQRIRLWLAIVHTFLTIISQIAGQMYAGALFIQKIFNWDLYLSVVLILGLTAVYTIIGGLTAVIWTDTIQTCILVIGASVLASITLSEVGGYESMKFMYQSAAANYTLRDVALYGNRTCGLPREDAFHIFRSVDSDFPWPGMVGGLTILAINAWCTDQICVQRSLSAKSVSHAKGGVLLAAYLKILSFLFFVIPGMISRIYYPNEVACADPDKCRAICGNPNGCTNIAYPLLVMRNLPTGAQGIMLAALLAALMSSLTSIFNSSSTVFTIDIWQRMRKNAKESELMVVGRVYTLFLAGVTILWLPILEQIQGSQFWDYLQSIFAYLLPPIVVTFLLGIFWLRATEKGAFYGLVVGLVCGLIRMGLAWSRAAPYCGSGEPDLQFKVVSQVHYLHFAMILAVIVFIANVCISCVTKPRPPEKLRRVTFWTRHSTELPELSESEEEDDSEEGEGTVYQYEIPSGGTSRVKYLATKWLCGVDRARKTPQLSREEMRLKMLEATNIKEDPFWKRFLAVNVIICAGVSVFLHGFFA